MKVKRTLSPLTAKQRLALSNAIMHVLGQAAESLTARQVTEGVGVRANIGEYTVYDVHDELTKLVTARRVKTSPTGVICPSYLSLAYSFRDD